MKNKKTQYILIPLVALIWGLIIVRIVKQVRNKSDIQIPYQMINADVPEEEDIKEDTLILVANYRDPFLGKRSYGYSAPVEEPAEQRNPKRSNNTDNTRRNIRQRLVRWPSVSYNGLVSSETKGKQVALVSINNQNYLMNTGDVNEEIELLKIYPDSVVLLYSEETKTFIKGR